MPNDDSDEGCDSPKDTPKEVWSRQINTIDIFEEDLISDEGQEIYNYFESKKIRM
ncbi:MAG: hypothetical protein QM485_15725 [Flavobacteriaceae bacterium]